MTTIDQERRQEIAAQTAAAAVPTSESGGSTRPENRAWLRERISSETAVLMGAAWFVLFFVATGLEPAATGSDPGWAVALSVTFLGVLGAAAVGLVARRRWGLLASLGAAGLFAALSVACPITGHHAFGAWWFGQMACVLALVAASAYALGRPAAAE